MPDKAALDSNIIAAIFFKEDASSRAMEAVTELDLITLDLAIAEVGNVAWKQVVLSGEDKELTLTALQKCLSFISEACDVVRAQDLVAEAYEISVETKVAFYDSLFLALSENEQVPLLTLDRKLYEKAKGKREVRLV
jgi:predicted nucleic acid-binding protein